MPRPSPQRSKTAYESFLITHAGVTAEFWATILGGPPTAAEAARRINELARAGADTVFRAGICCTEQPSRMPGRCGRTPPPNCCPDGRTAACRSVRSTATTASPHGADTTSPFPRTGINALVTIDQAAKHETVHLDGGRLIGIDPDHRETPTTPWHALELTGTVTAR